MGEQNEAPNPTLQESLAVIPCSDESHPEPFSNDPSASMIELTVCSAPHHPSPPSKFTPSRPRKTRKLSLESDSPTVSPGDGIKSLTSVHAEASKPPILGKPKSLWSSHHQGASMIQSSATQVKPIRMIPRSLSSEGEVETAISHLRMADALLASLIDLYPPPCFDTFQTPFLALTRSILYQQLAFKAGASIYSRFISLCGSESGVVPETVLALSAQQLRQIGVSGRKASYLHDLAKKYQNGILSDSAIVNMDDKSLFTMLTMVNGIGSWSVHMFMIFSLHRPDVLPINDLGVRKGVQLLYKLEELPRPSQMDQLCDKWRPYRSVGAWYLWRYVETKGSSSNAVAVSTVGGMMQPMQKQVIEQAEDHRHPQPSMQQTQIQTQPQLFDPINSILNLGYEFE